MRPLAGDDAHGRPRSSNPESASTFRLPAAPQMTYMLASEDSASFPSTPMPPASHRRPKEHHHHQPQRLTQHFESELSRSRDRDRARDHVTPPPAPIHDIPSSVADPPRPASPMSRPPDAPSLSQPLTPLLSGITSALSSISSRRNSFCLSDDLPSRAPSTHDDEVAVEDDEEEEDESRRPRAEAPPDQAADADPGTASCSSMMDSGSAPQLVMPSIKMPSRRPFTDNGKRMGRLKLLIAGDSGVGKTSLIKAIVQSCEHIVHVDPINPSSSSSPSVTLPSVGPRGTRRRSSKPTTGTAAITEIYASTKPYPEWWSEVDDFGVLRRRKSLGDAVLDRNICFVDTPGYGSGSSSMDTITPVAQYVEGHLQRISSNMLTDGDLLNLLGGEGGVQVDVVFYLVSNRLRPVDLEYLGQLAPLTNIILLLAQADLMSAEQVAASKEQIHRQLQEAEIRLFTFCLPSPNHPASEHGTHGIYAISSIAGPDHDTMDASLLMSPDYIQPLIPSELPTLVSHVFTPNGIAWLRHSVARKYVQWRKAAALASVPSFPSPSRPLSLGRNQTLTPSSLVSSQPSLAPTNLLSQSPSSVDHALTASSILGAGTMSPPATSYALARLVDHTQREERLAQVRLANWAADLQRSVAREREQYARLARADRALWLAERIGECVREGSLVVAGQQGDVDGEKREREQQARSISQSLAASPLPATSPTSGRSGGLPSSRGRRTGGRTPPSQTHPRTRTQSRQSQGHAKTQAQTTRNQDPLGLLDLADDLRRKGLAALELLGGIGVLGGLAVWMARNGLHLQIFGWVLEGVEKVLG
ncbi:hypothetical protein VTJ49DRAFT_4861 [Mycothermus thermophilus]|uniref:Septin-type G domain-containing protein n=1 Tax=Humicola insolens TaxID=85995 RepID=A0ABR3V4W8_HUMIN